MAVSRAKACVQYYGRTPQNSWAWSKIWLNYVLGNEYNQAFETFYINSHAAIQWCTLLDSSVWTVFRKMTLHMYVFDQWYVVGTYYEVLYSLMTYVLKFWQKLIHPGLVGTVTWIFRERFGKNTSNEYKRSAVHFFKKYFKIRPAQKNLNIWDTV